MDLTNKDMTKENLDFHDGFTVDGTQQDLVLTTHLHGEWS